VATHPHAERCPSSAPDAASPARDTAPPVGDAALSPKFGMCDTASKFKNFLGGLKKC
jgi:hypothetical protein